jgi:hypothetical protein
MPNCRLPAGAGAAWLTDLLRHTRFTLLAAVPDSAPEASLEAWLETTANRYRGRVEVRVVPRASSELVGTDGRAHCYLVRPDGYVAASASPQERGEIDRWLGATLR